MSEQTGSGRCKMITFESLSLADRAAEFLVGSVYREDETICVPYEWTNAKIFTKLALAGIEKTQYMIEV